MYKKLLGLAGLSCLALIIAGCGTVAQEPSAAPVEAEKPQIASTTEAEAEAAAIEAASPANRRQSTRIDQFGTEVELQPKNTLAEGEYRWSQLLPRDGIRPIYEEELEFADAENAPYSDDELVIGVEINGEARAYAIGPLNGREMVNDNIGGVPILVTW